MLDITYLLVIPAMIFVFFAQARMRGVYDKYKNVKSASGMTGAEAAAALLNQAGINDVSIERIPGRLTDHYDPRVRALRLSAGVYDSNSVVAIGIAAHETGHAIQHSDAYVPLNLRSAVLPAASLGSKAAWPLFILGIFLTYNAGDFGYVFMQVGIVLFSMVLLFQLVTLPVEFNASRRAVELLDGNGLLNESELPLVKKVLGAAAMTYVAALAVTLSNLLRMLVLSGKRRR